MQSIQEDGYIILPNIVSEELLKKCKQEIQSYIKHKPKGCLNNAGGYAIPDILRRPELKITASLKDNPKLQENLKKIFGNKPFRFCSHNDIGANRIVSWHKDRLNGEVRKFEKISPWGKGPKGEVHNIVKVLIYLQDHSKDNDGLKLVPKSHRNPKIKQLGYVQLHPKLGDVVVFDQRITHRGMDRQVNSARILVSYGFGEDNVFTDNFELGTMVRQNKQNSSLSL